MAINKDDPFEALVGGVFSTDDLARINQGLAPYTIEPIQPAREELLTHFDILLEQLLVAKQREAKRACEERFLGNMITVFEARAGEPIQVRRAASCITQLACGDRSWAMFQESATLGGEFNGLAVGDWYDMPIGVEPPEDEDPYYRKYGLFVMLLNPELTFDDGERLELEGITGVPLNHGKPDLYRVIYQ